MNSTIAMSTPASPPTSTTASTLTRTAASSSTTSSVCFLHFFVLSRTPSNLNCQDSDGPVPLELPEQWLWDIIDEFIYQFQAFCVWRSKVKSKTEEELTMLADANQVRRLARL